MNMYPKKILIDIFIITVIVLFASIPFLYFHFADYSLINSEHSRRTIDSQLDPLIDELYISGAIRDAYVLGNSMSSSEEYTLSFLIQEINKLRLAGINLMNEVNIEEASEISLEIPEDRGSSGKYQTACLDVSLYDTAYQIQFYLAEKTNTILYLSIDQIVLVENNDNVEPSKASETQFDYTALWIYCKYLGLDIADDWQEVNGKLISEKAQITIYYKQTETSFLLYAAYDY